MKIHISIHLDGIWWQMINDDCFPWYIQHCPTRHLCIGQWKNKWQNLEILWKLLCPIYNNRALKMSKDTIQKRQGSRKEYIKPLYINLFIFGVYIVRIFPYSDWIWRLAEQIYVFSQNYWKIRTRKTTNTETFQVVPTNHIYMSETLPSSLP